MLIGPAEEFEGEERPGAERGESCKKEAAIVNDGAEVCGGEGVVGRGGEEEIGDEGLERRFGGAEMVDGE